MNYAFTITETERQLLAEAFGILARKLANCAPIIEDRKDNRPISDLGPPKGPTHLTQPSTSAQAQNTPAAAQTSAPIEVRDRWARDRRGKEVANPEGSWPADVRIWKTESQDGKQGKYLRVTWEDPSGGHASANCFDPQLSPWLIKQKGEKTRLYLASNGKFMNVVGVRA